ncbi:MAG: EthD family reductase [Pararhodobacter sp.]|nr:EthD family reductase [Pararhodobacter sp.]
MTIRRFGLIRQRQDLDPEAFSAYWRGPHADMVRPLPGVRGYEQNLVTDRSQFGVDHPRGQWDIDGIACLTFDDDASMRGVMATPAFAAVVADTPNFAEPIGSLICETHQVIPTAPTAGTGVKRMSLLRRHAHVDPETFRHEWLEVHAGLVRQWPGVLGYTQNLVVERSRPGAAVTTYDDLPVDGIVEFWFETTDVAGSLYASDVVLRTQQHAHTFIAEITPFFVSTNRVV